MNNDDPTVRNTLFGAVRLTESADFNRYGYSDYRIGFDGRGSFSFPGGGFDIDVTILGIDMSYSIYVDNKKRTF